MDWNKILKRFLGKDDDKVSSGGFGNSENSSLISKKPGEESTEFELLVRGTEQYRLFKEQIYNPQSVFYPSCGTDVTPAKIFDNVTFLDIQKLAFERLRENGYNAINEDIKKHLPQERYDLLILMNPQIREEDASQHLVPGGYVITNNSHGNAAEMYWKPDQFNLIGAFQSNNLETKINYDVQGLEFVPIPDSEENIFRKSKKGEPNKKIGEPYIFQKK